MDRKIISNREKSLEKVKTKTKSPQDTFSIILKLHFTNFGPESTEFQFILHSLHFGMLPI